MKNNNSKRKSGSSNNDKFKFHLFSRNSELDNYHKNNSVKNSSLWNQYLNKDNNINSFKYDKLYFYEKGKQFANELKNNKSKKIKINLKKISNFHQLCIHNKIRSFSESLDYNDLTLNNKTTNISEYNYNNTSNNINNRNLINFIQNLQNYNKEFEKMKTNANIIINKNNLTLDKSNSKILDNDLTTNIGYSQRSIINDKKIYNKKIRHSIDINNLKIKKPIKILNYKFKNILGNPNDNIYTEGEFCPYRHQNNILSEQIKTQLKLNIINKMQNDFFLTQSEKFSNPKIMFQHYEKFYDKNKNYFEVFGNLVKKYFSYLYLNIENEKHKLQLLKERKESLKNEIFHINKKINSQKDKKNFFQNLIILLTKIRYNVDDIDKIPNEYLKKYGINKIARNNKYASQIFKKRNSMLITELKDFPYMKYLRKSNPDNINQKNFNIKRMGRKKTVLMDLDDIKPGNISFKSKSPEKRKSGYDLKPKFPIFNSSNELDAKIKGIEYNLLQSFKLFSDKRYLIQKYKLELNDSILEFIKSNKNKNSVYSFIQSENEEAKIVKQRYEDLLKLKNILLNSKDNYIEYKPNAFNNNSNKKNKKLKFPEKLIKYILKINKSIDIEKLLKGKGIYKFLNSPEETKIIYKTKEYNKIIFCVKILESVFLYLMKERSLFLLNEKNKEKYLSFKEMIDKNNRYAKLREISNNENIRRHKKEEELLLKYNKLNLLPIKKDDPFSSYMMRNKTFHIANKKRIRTEANAKIDLILENEILF